MPTEGDTMPTSMTRRDFLRRSALAAMIPSAVLASPSATRGDPPASDGEHNDIELRQRKVFVYRPGEDKYGRRFVETTWADLRKGDIFMISDPDGMPLLNLKAATSHGDDGLGGVLNVATTDPIIYGNGIPSIEATECLTIHEAKGMRYWTLGCYTGEEVADV